MTRVWPSMSPNSGPATMHTFSLVLDSKYALPISVAHTFKSLSSKAYVYVQRLLSIDAMKTPGPVLKRIQGMAQPNNRWRLNEQTN